MRRYLIIVPAVLFAIPTCMMACVYGFDQPQQYAKQHADIGWNAENQMIENLQTISLLGDECWALLGDQQKLDVLQVIADIETNHLSIQPVYVVDCCLGEGTIGAYDYDGRRVKVDLDKHQGYESMEYVNTVLHECRHAYQYDCIASLDWSDPQVQSGIYYDRARQWLTEHTNYIRASENRDGYYNQEIEIDARRYADDGVYLYQQYLYLSELPSR